MEIVFSRGRYLGLRYLKEQGYFCYKDRALPIAAAIFDTERFDDKWRFLTFNLNHV